MSSSTESRWRRYPGAASFVDGLVARACAAMPPLAAFAGAAAARTGTRLGDWIDHIVVAGQTLRGFGFERRPEPAAPGDEIYVHPAALFPRLVLRPGSGCPAGEPVAAALRVDDVSRFLSAQRMDAAIHGGLLGPLRAARIWSDGVHELAAVERRGRDGSQAADAEPDRAARWLEARERWLTRTRTAPENGNGAPGSGDLALMQRTLELARSLAQDMGTGAAAWMVFEVEREYWRSRNRAAQAQGSRQDALGLGWANHDHHTFRSSRPAFPLLVDVLESLGFEKRERFYAGAEAGWGAQVMEQPACGLVVFADVDLSPGEAGRDFSVDPLPERDQLGTVGLWCALHGESMLGAGLHHLACRADFDGLASGLAEWGIEMMAPFSNFNHLKQAFTRGEFWEVQPARLAGLVGAGLITPAQADRFASEGAVGSHLENIQRSDGYKGFNQESVNDIIRRTDPRAGGGFA